MYEEKKYDIAIIGAGPAGLTAGIYGARGGFKTIIFAGAVPGGQLLQTNDIENFPGNINPISGYELMDRILKQTKRLGAEILNEQVIDLEVCCSPFKISTPKETYYSKTVIISTGASPKWLAIPGETEFRNKGVSSCATCDGFFFKGKDVCVIGGGDTAAEDSLFLSKFVNKVYLIHRRDKLKAAYRLQEKLKNNSKIEIIYDHIPEEIIGDEKVKGVIIKNVKTQEKRKIEVSGVFVAIGHRPNTELFKNKLHMDNEGYIIVSPKFETSIEGIYAAGDVCDTIYKQAIVAAGSGCMAAMNAIKYLESKS